MLDNHSTNSELVANLSEVINLSKQSYSETLNPQFHQISDAIYQQLLVLSEQSIFAPSDQVAQFRECFLNSIYQLKFDPLFGGLIACSLSQESCIYYQKPLLFNCLITDLFLQVDRLLYTGELTQVAKLGIQFLHRQLEATQGGLLNKQMFFTKIDCENVFQREQLESLFNNQESLLLGALIADKQSAIDTVLKNNIISVYYYRSLSKAASLIDMPFKQAQILEHAIQLKLKSTYSEKQLHIEEQKDGTKQITSHNLDNMILINSLILQTISNGIFYLEQPIEQPNLQPIKHAPWQTNANKLASALIDLLDGNDLSNKDRVRIMVAMIYYLQTNFCPIILEKLFQSLKQVNFEKLVQQPNYDNDLETKQTVQQLSLLAAFVSTINQSGILDFIEVDLQATLSGYLDQQWTIVILQKHAVQLDSQLVQLKSEFNPYRLVFCV